MEFKFEVVEYKFGEKFEIISHGVFQNMIDAWYYKKMQESNGGDGSIFTVNVIVTNNIDQEFRNV